MGKKAQPGPKAESRDAPGIGIGLRGTVYVCFLLSGATALVFEVEWSRQFVTVFGNSAYAISIVLCAFMAGLGTGGWLGGRLADRYSLRLFTCGLIHVGIALWALGMPTALGALRGWVPRWPMLAPESLAVSSAWRFMMSFAILFVPCTLMGATLPLLSRFCAESRDLIGRRVGLLYGLNTLGAAAGCFLAGLWMVRVLGLSMSNRLALGTDLVIGGVMLLVGRRVIEGKAAPGPSAGWAQSKDLGAREEGTITGRDGRLLLGVAFLSGMLGLSCQVLWVRFQAYFASSAYAFTAVLGTYLLGLSIGSLIYRLFLAPRRDALRCLAWTLFAAAWAIPLFFTAAALGASYHELWQPASVVTVAAVAVLVPTIAMGMVFPLVCAAFARSEVGVGRGVGAVYAVNMAGSIVGSLIPVFVLIPALGVQQSVMATALLYWLAAMGLLAVLSKKAKPLPVAGAAAGIAATALAFLFARPAQLCERAFLSNLFAEGRNKEIVFYKEGMTATSIIIRDRIDHLKELYIDSNLEVPTARESLCCFKLMGALGPLLHPNPKDVLVVCLGAGVAAGTAAMQPEVQKLEILDLESSVIEAARLFEKENNGVLLNPKVRVIVDDGRNYIMTSDRKWPVIVSDSTHPKHLDSWVLYTQEFYRTVKEHLTEDGVFVEWVPLHLLSIREYKTIARTFQSVFPHASLWFSYGVDETMGNPACYTFLVATPGRLSIDVASLRRKLSVPAVKADLAPWRLESAAGVLENFICAEDRFREWVGPGPVNTDDLPYTQYRTALTQGSACSLSAFMRPLESIWPYLSNAGNEAEAAALKQELASRLEAKEDFMGLGLQEALARHPGDPKLEQLAEMDAAGRRYIASAAGYCWDAAKPLEMLARVLAGHYDDQQGGAELCKRAIALSPTDRVAHEILARLLLAAGRGEEALAEYRVAVALGPNDATTWQLLGTCLSALGRTEEAIAEYRRAVELDPQNAAAYCLMGEALAKQGELAKATGCFRLAVEADPELGQARAELGIALVAQQDFADGAAQFGEAMRCNPYMVWERCSMGSVLARLGRTEEAAAQFSEALKIDPKNEPALHGLAAAEERRPADSAPGQSGSRPSGSE